MAFVAGMGARVYLHAVPGVPNPAPDGTIGFGCQLFAVLASGSIVMATHANGITVERVPSSVEEVAEMIQLGLHEPTIEPELRSSVFGNVVDELARLDIRTDLETLMHLPFHVEVTDEVRALLADG